MCSRYQINANARALAARFDLIALPPIEERDEVRPTDDALTILAGRRPAVLAWGLRSPMGDKPLINAQAETLAERPTFRPLLETGRCLVPATAYFEWRRDGRRSLKNRIAPADGRPFAFAGLTDGARFAIVTCAPAPAIAAIHDRMPVILDEAREAQWIDPARPFAEVARLLAPYAAQPLAAVEDAPPADRQLTLL